MRRIEMSGALGVEHPEGTPEGFRLLRLQENPFTLYEIPIPKELVDHIAKLMMLSDEELATTLEREARAANAKSKLAMPNGDPVR